MRIVSVLLCAYLFQAVSAGPGLPQRLESKGKWGFVDAEGNVVIEPKYRLAGGFTPDGIAPVLDDKGWVYIDTQGRELVRPLVSDNGPDYFIEGLARFTSGRKIGYFDTKGKVVIPAQFDFGMPFSEGRAAVCEKCKTRQEGSQTIARGGRWGFVDRTGTVVIPLQFEEVESFKNGVARVRTSEGWRLIDLNGARVLE
jgi:hypothetical protein